MQHKVRYMLAAIAVSFAALLWLLFAAVLAAGVSGEIHSIRDLIPDFSDSSWSVRNDAGWFLGAVITCQLAFYGLAAGADVGRIPGDSDSIREHLALASVFLSGAGLAIGALALTEVQSGNGRVAWMICVTAVVLLSVFLTAHLGLFAVRPVSRQVEDAERTVERMNVVIERLHNASPFSPKIGLIGYAGFGWIAGLAMYFFEFGTSLLIEDIPGVLLLMLTIFLVTWVSLAARNIFIVRMAPGDRVLAVFAYVSVGLTLGSSLAWGWAANNLTIIVAMSLCLVYLLSGAMPVKLIPRRVRAFSIPALGNRLANDVAERRRKLSVIRLQRLSPGHMTRDSQPFVGAKSGRNVRLLASK